MNATDALATYLSAVLAMIAPHMREARRVSITQDVATVTLAQDRAFDNDENGQRTGLLMLSLADYETGHSWSAWVDDGSCNDPAWRESHKLWMRNGDCDSGKAWSMWQVHAPGDNPEIGRTYVVDRKNGIRAALLVARESLKAGVGLCHYTGEAFPRCRLGDRRLNTAKDWVTKYPFRPEIASGGDHSQTGIE
jgi:hypothetical protein